ncbi:MAG: LysR family transcriptional regulator, partial [Polyangiaceae bacterium]|nr:LysR family transcriptional regulator [Polyangiaceae bacterium]
MNPSALRSDWLATFAVFAEHLNFTHAARALALSQPAVHVQISRLAEELGVPLYVRRGRALELTAEGVELLAFTREAREHAARFAARFDARNRGEESVALASGEGAYLYLLGDALRAFGRRSKARLR